MKIAKGITFRKEWLINISLLLLLVNIEAAGALCPQCKQEVCTCLKASQPVEMAPFEKSDERRIEDARLVVQLVELVHSLGPYRVNEANSNGELQIPGAPAPYHQGILATPLLISSHEDKIFVKAQYDELNKIVQKMSHETPIAIRFSLWVALHILPLDSWLSSMLDLPKEDKKILDIDWVPRFIHAFELIPEHEHLRTHLDLLDAEIRHYMSTPSQVSSNYDYDLECIYSAHKNRALFLTHKLVKKLGVIRLSFLEEDIEHAINEFEEIVRIGHIQVAVPAFKYIGQLSPKTKNKPLNYDQGQIIIFTEKYSEPFSRMLNAAAESGVEEAGALYEQLNIKTGLHVLEPLFEEARRKKINLDKIMKVHESGTQDPMDYFMAIHAQILDQFKKNKPNMTPDKITDDAILELDIITIEQSIKDSLKQKPTTSEQIKIKDQLNKLFFYDISPANLSILTRRLLNTLGNSRINSKCPPDATKENLATGPAPITICSPFIVYDNHDYFEIIPTLVQLNRKCLLKQHNHAVLWNYANLALLLAPLTWENIRLILFHKRNPHPKLKVSTILLTSSALKCGVALTKIIFAILSTMEKSEIEVSQLFEPARQESYNYPEVTEIIRVIEAVTQVYRNLQNEPKQLTIRALTPLVNIAETGFTQAGPLINEIMTDMGLTVPPKKMEWWNRTKTLAGIPSEEPVLPEPLAETFRKLGLDDDHTVDPSEDYLKLIDMYNPSSAEKKKKKRKKIQKSDEQVKQEKIKTILEDRKGEAVTHFKRIIQKDKSGEKVTDANRARLRKIMPWIPLPKSDEDHDNLFIGNVLTSEQPDVDQDNQKLIGLYLVNYTNPENLLKAANLLTQQLEKKRDTEWLNIAANGNLEYNTGLLLVAPFLEKTCQASVLAIIPDDELVEVIHNSILLLSFWLIKDPHIHQNKLRKSFIYLLNKIGDEMFQFDVFFDRIKQKETTDIIAKWLATTEVLISDKKIVRKSKARINQFKEKLDKDIKLKKKQQQIETRAEPVKKLETELEPAPEPKEKSSHITRSVTNVTPSTHLPPSEDKRQENLKRSHRIKVKHDMSTSISENTTNLNTTDEPSIVCAICLEEFQTDKSKIKDESGVYIDRRPASLSCIHSFCRHCLKILKKDARIDCPECRKTYCVKDNDINTIPLNYMLIDSLKVINKLKADLKLK